MEAAFIENERSAAGSIDATSVASVRTLAGRTVLSVRTKANDYITTVANIFKTSF